MGACDRFDLLLLAVMSGFETEEIQAIIATGSGVVAQDTDTQA